MTIHLPYESSKRQKFPEGIFVSYKSQNAHLARAVVEALMCRGIKMWFAEYNLLTKEQIHFQDVFSKAFEKARRNGCDQEAAKEMAAAQSELAISEELQDGVRSSLYGLAFTNQLWGNSDFCTAELDWLRNEFGEQTSRILQVCVPNEPLPEKVAKKLHGLPTLIQDPLAPDVEAIVAFVLAHVDSQKPAAPVPRFAPGNPRTIHDRGAWANFQLGQFEVQPDSLSEFHDQLHADRSRQFNGTFSGVALRMSITFQHDRAVLTPWQLSQVHPLSEAKTDLPIDPAPIEKGMKKSLDDRQIMDLLRREAAEWYRGKEFRERGCHLFWHGTTGHLAMTFMQPPSQGSKGGWHRMYILVLEDPASGLIGELDVSFAVPFDDSSDESSDESSDGGEERAAFEKLLTIAPALDQLVGTFKYHGRKKHALMEVAFTTLLSVVVCGALGFLCLAPIGLPWSILAGAAAGLLAVPATLRRLQPGCVKFHL